ncbi:MAG: type II toxin-antitoxin system RelE/ParE family toxin [Propionibacteriaceae bacterium]|jgi:plasmid stabilization system protein ParE|nr:type II toxin-antitoxin system RelE/ParE family toxin [Propionibacteriaceae bacterium]
MAVKYRIVVRPLAKRDLDEAAAYLADIDTDLALRLFDDVERASIRLETFPFVGREPYRGVRRVALDVFPYHLYYRVTDHAVHVIALLHNRRGPDVVSRTMTGR